RIVRCGVDTSVFQPSSDRRARSAGPLRIVCNGTFYEVKGHRYLIAACRLLAKWGVEFRCRMIGDGPLRDQLEQLAHQEGVADCIEWLGHLPRHDVANQLRWASVLVAPSIPASCGRREGIPVVLMEAMASGVPVIASRISGIPELIEHGETGLLVPPRDPQRLAEAMQLLHFDAELAEHLAANGRQKVATEYNQQRNAQHLAQLFAGG